MPTDYSKTVHLPKTNFPMRGDLPKREPEMLEFWESKGIYKRLQSEAAQRPRFVLHDGPPYANGHIHIGHALNKILKDVVVKSHALMGARSPYLPGWDCHGLPIETALLKELKTNKRGVEADVPAFRRKCREFAQRFIAVQRDEFKRLEILGDWEEPYTTMTPEYEAKVLGAFRELYRRGFIYQGLKSVSWCFTCETALAEAEVEYKDKTSPSVYVALPIVSSSALKEKGLEEGAEVLVWTTTPWTLPANMAVAFHPDLEYVLAEVRLPNAQPRRLLLAQARLEAVLKELGAEGSKELGRWMGRDLAPRQAERRDRVNLLCRPPYDFGGGSSVSVLADYVTAEDGTGVVHTAPGHGADDFETGQWYQLKVFSPVDGSGRFTAQAGEFQGLRVFPEGNERVVEDLRSRGLLLRSAAVSHSYPHCWRCKNPTIFRATDQWFLKVDHEGLREKLVKAIEEVHWVPEEGRGRISAMVMNRPDWCISRQRFWGIPIPVLYCAACGRMPEADAIAAIERRVAREGTDFWFEDYGNEVYWTVQRGPGDDTAAQGALLWEMGVEVSCANKACEDSRRFRRETDILDVWAESGCSWLGVLEPKGEWPCDIYLEGSDQHRGWFMSSLVLSTALKGRAPYKTVLTHGFVLDEHGRAMHKSLGNVVAPQEVVDKSGADVLRLWAALADYSDDVRLSDKLLEGPTEAYRKIRNTLRYLLGNLADYDPARHPILNQQLPGLEQYILRQLYETEKIVFECYDSFRFREAATAIIDFCNLKLSAFYLDVRKDALYTLDIDHMTRRAAQAVMWECLIRVQCLVAPILSFTAEEAWQEIRRNLAEQNSSQTMAESVFLNKYQRAPSNWNNQNLDVQWAQILDNRSSVMRVLEVGRKKQLIGSSLQAKVIVRISENDQSSFHLWNQLDSETWADIFITSGVEIQELPKSRIQDLNQQFQNDGFHVWGRSDGSCGNITVEKADGSKCARCWRYRTDVGRDAAHPQLCSRCARQLV